MFENETILAVDDKKENLDVILDMLDDFDVIPVINGQKAIEIVNNEKISLILLDIVMPELDGYEVCKIIKSQQNSRDIPIIFTTAKTDEESISRAYAAGASDYVSKPLKRTEVLERVKTQLRLKKTIEELEFLASRDSMTGAYNRRKFFELAREMLLKTNKTFFVSMIDIDFFKKINDGFGHDAGDLVIKSVSQTIAKMLPDESVFARIGGEEFVTICALDSKIEAIELFETVRKKIESMRIDYNDRQIEFTISNGITQNSDASTTIDMMLKQADLALYDAKNSGRNRVVFRVQND